MIIHLTFALKQSRLKTRGFLQSVDTKPLPADAGRIIDVPFEVLKYDILGDRAIGG